MMPDIFNTIEFSTLTFHLLRPWWLMAILPALALAWLLLKRRADNSGWAAVIDSELLNELLDGQQQAHTKWPMHALLLAWILAACAMAGPCFEKNNQAALKQADAVVILLDLSPSMLAQDVQPSRLQAAHYKILDLLHQRREGYTGLIAYSGSAHVVAPLSDDTNTIAALVNTLTPNIMPSIGSSVEDAISEALQLLENSHFSRGRILLLTDGVVPEALENIHQQLKGKSIELDVIGIGTSAGAPISLPGGNFVKDNNGNILMNKLDESTLQKTAQENGGYYSPLRADDKDIAPLIAPPDWLAQMGNGDSRDASHTVENWQDIGYWLALPCALLVLLFFRRGVLICLLPLLLLTHQESVRADNIPTETGSSFPQTWQDWWQTPDQQATAALEKNDAATAAKQFTDPQWKAYAEYQNGQHKEAAEHFAQSNSATAKYNRGNAQAKAGDLQGALDSYEQSLKQNPGFADAEFNRDLVKKMLEEQKKNQQDQKNTDQNKSQDQKQQDQNQQQDQQQQNQQQKDQQQQDQENNQDQQQQQDKQQSDSNNEQQSDEQKSEEEKQAENDKNSTEEKQSEADKQAQEQKEKQEKAEQENESAESKQPEDKKDPENKDTVSDAEGKSQADKEKQQANEQWLRKVPDDPGGLLKNKFEYYYQLNRQKEARERRAGSSNEEEQRW